MKADLSDYNNQVRSTDLMFAASEKLSKTINNKVTQNAKVIK